MLEKLEPKLKRQNFPDLQSIKDELQKKQESYFEEFTKLKMRRSEHPHLSGKIRKNIARLLTFANEKRRAKQKDSDKTDKTSKNGKNSKNDAGNAPKITAKPGDTAHGTHKPSKPSKS